MTDYLLDTGVLIRLLRNTPGYRELVAQLENDGQLHVASFTRLEIIRGMRDHEREATYDLLDALIAHPLDAETADEAGEMIRAWQQRGIIISGPDAVIAATALRCGAILVTTNPKHFPATELAVLSASEEGELRPYNPAT